MTTETPPTQCNPSSVEGLRECLGAITRAREIANCAGEENGPDEHLADAIQSLWVLSKFFRANSIVSPEISRLYTECMSIGLKDRSSPMLLYRGGRGRPRATGTKAIHRGQVAAVVEYRRREFGSRSKSSAWVTDNLPEKTRKLYGSPSAKTIDGWLTKYGWSSDAWNLSSRSFIMMMEWLSNNRPTDEQILAFLENAEVYLPPLASPDSREERDL